MIIFWLDEQPIHFNKDRSLELSLEFLKNAQEDFEEAADSLFRNILVESIELLEEYGLSDQEWSSARDAVLIATFGYRDDEILNEYAWVLSHLEDLTADFWRFYGLDMYALDSRTFYTLAERVHVYGGVMGQRVNRQREVMEEVA